MRVLLYNGAGPVKVASSKGGILVNGQKKTLPEMTLSSSSVSQIQEFRSESGLVKFQGTAYRGTLRVYPASGRIQVVNVAELEDYLRGVVPKELLDSSLEAVKAQAVLARTYALATAAKSPKDSVWELRDDTGHQVYGGADAEHEISDAAVRETKGGVLAYRGRLCSAVLYHSTCGGYTESNENAYGTPPVPYLRAVSCGSPACGAAKDGRNKGQSAARSEASGSRPPRSLAERRARRDQVWKASETGQGRSSAALLMQTPALPSVLGLSASLGTGLASMAQRFRYASGGTSAWCSSSSFARWEACWTPAEIGQEVGRKLGKSAFPIVGLNVEERTPSGRIRTLRVDFANGSSASVAGDTIRNTLCYLNAAGGWCALPSTRFDIVEVSKKVIRVRGTGWGHGVGMCQWGAKGLARRGYSAAKILSHYYAGTEVVPMETLGLEASSH